MSSKRRTLIAIPLLATAIVLAACGAATSPLGEQHPPTVVAGAGSDDLKAPTTNDQPGRDGVVGPGEPGRPVVGSLVDDARILRTGTLELEVTGFAEGLTRARTTITGFGGYIAASEERHEADRQFASVTYRVPVDRWDAAVDALRGIATTVIHEQSQAVEVTAQIVDLDARIANLKATEQALVAIMAKATRIPDILEVQAQLTTVRSQIEQLTAQRAQLADQADYGTISVAWSTPAAPVVETQQAWDPASEVQRALATLLSVGQAAATAGIWLLIVGLPLLAGLGILAAVVWAVARRAGRQAPAGTGEAPAGA